MRVQDDWLGSTHRVELLPAEEEEEEECLAEEAGTASQHAAAEQEEGQAPTAAAEAAAAGECEAAEEPAVARGTAGTRRTTAEDSWRSVLQAANEPHVPPSAPYEARQGQQDVAAAPAAASAEDSWRSVREVANQPFVPPAVPAKEARMPAPAADPQRHVLGARREPAAAVGNSAQPAAMAAAVAAAAVVPAAAAAAAQQPGWRAALAELLCLAAFQTTDFSVDVPLI